MDGSCSIIRLIGWQDFSIETFSEAMTLKKNNPPMFLAKYPHKHPGRPMGECKGNTIKVLEECHQNVRGTPGRVVECI